MSPLSLQPNAAPSDPDQNLIDQIKWGDPAAAEAIVRRYRARIYSRTYQLLHNQEDAEEITQDAFLRAFRGLKGFRGDSTFSTWLYRIATNLARNRYHYWLTRRRDKMVSLDSPVHPDGGKALSEVIAAETDSAYAMIDRDELLDRIRAGFDRISSPHREILRLRTMGDLSYEKIAQTLGISVGTVKSRICRARENLRAVVTTARSGYARRADAPLLPPPQDFKPA